ncbi:MAG: hypothetical protein IT537_25580 [Hyphomicrobiales bacterium]|nr:hypothetical protein [Hyphomicrobiales bacterium]
MVARPQGTISDQDLQDAVECKRSELYREVGVRIRKLIDGYLPSTQEQHALSDPRRIPQEQRAAFLQELEKL